MPEPDGTQAGEQERTAQERKEDTKWTKKAALSFAAVGLVGLVVYALQYSASSWPRWQQFFDVFGRGLLISCASFLVGILLGFVFGIPRALQGQSQLTLDQTQNQRKGEAVQGDTLRPAYQVNTNFEQISDWLTKIIVGVGLVEMGKFPDLFKRLGEYLAPCLGDHCKSPSVVVVIVVLFAVLGFLAGYLFMRLYFTGAFWRAEVVQPSGSIKGSFKDWDEELKIPLM